MLIKAANWQLSFLYQIRCFQNRNLGYNFQTLLARKRGFAHLLFLCKWITSTLSLILLENNSNIFNPWGPVFPRSPLFHRSWVPVRVWVPFFDDVQNNEQFQKLQKQCSQINMLAVFRQQVCLWYNFQ